MGTPASLPRRKNMRLNGYDYACEGAYFITVVTKDRQALFGKVVDGEMVLNDYGRIVAEEWERSGVIRAEIELDEYVVMPNHFHAIVNIFQTDTDNESSCRGDRPIDQINPTVVGAYGHTPLQNQFKSPSRTLGSLVRGFKSAVTMRINTMRGTAGVPVWQRNYHDHVIRSDREYEDVAGYIASNPANWLMDTERSLEA